MIKRNAVTTLLAMSLLVTGCNDVKGELKPDKKIMQNIEHTNSKINLPWEKDPEFTKTINEHNVTVMMAAYQATLPDPILNERENIALAAEYLKGAVVEPGETFSLNKRLGWRSADRGFKPGPMYSGGRIVSTIGGGVCKIASVLYNVAVLADQKIIERHPHSMTVPYVPPGQDATISYGTKDFKFKNTTEGPIVIWSQNTGGTLYIAFYSRSQPPHVRWIHNVLRESKTWTEYTWDSSIPKGEKKVIHHGSKGISVRSWVIVTTPDGKENIRDMGISAYRPCPEIIAKGTKPKKE